MSGAVLTRERRTGVLALVLGVILIGLAQRIAPLTEPPLYDGVYVPQPYVWLVPPAGAKGGAKGAKGSVGVDGGANRLVAVATPEQDPQAQILATSGALVLPGRLDLGRLLDRARPARAAAGRRPHRRQRLPDQGHEPGRGAADGPRQRPRDGRHGQPAHRPGSNDRARHRPGLAGAHDPEPGTRGLAGGGHRVRRVRGRRTRPRDGALSHRDAGRRSPRELGAVRGARFGRPSSRRRARTCRASASSAVRARSRAQRRPRRARREAACRSRRSRSSWRSPPWP